MTRGEKAKILWPLRFAVKGWAFTDGARLPGKLAHCERIAAALPSDVSADAAEILRPLREACT